MNRKNMTVLLFLVFFCLSCSTKSAEPDLDYLLPTESPFMTLLDNKSKGKIIEKSITEFTKVEKEDVFGIKDLKKYYAYEEKIGNINKYCIFAALFKTKRCDGSKKNWRGVRFQSKWILFPSQ